MHDSRRTRLMLGVLLAAALALITFDSWGGAAGAASPVAGLRGVGGRSSAPPRAWWAR